MHISQLHKVVEQGEFSISFVTKAGELIRANRCVCTSWHSSGCTMNIKLCDSEQIRTIRRMSIVEFNGKEIYL